MRSQHVVTVHVAGSATPIRIIPKKAAEKMAAKIARQEARNEKARAKQLAQ